MESDSYSAEKHGDSKAERTTTEVTEVNASGHVQELDRHFGLLSIIGTGVTVGAAWPAVGGSIVSDTLPSAPSPRSFTHTTRSFPSTTAGHRECCMNCETVKHPGLVGVQSL